jgi:hypothetical protein
MSNKGIESDLKEHIDNGYIIISQNGCLSYLNSDGTTCPVNEKGEHVGEV